MTLKVAPLKRVPLHMEVARLVRDMIIDGSLVAGEHIKELALCENCKSVVRHCAKRLKYWPAKAWW